MDQGIDPKHSETYTISLSLSLSLSLSRKGTIFIKSPYKVQMVIR